MQGLRNLEKEIFISQVEQATKVTKSVKDMQKTTAEYGLSAINRFK